jgi:hypothetical protein
MRLAQLKDIRFRRRQSVNILFSTLAKGFIGKHYVFMPMGKLVRSRKVKCPESDQPAEILVDTTPVRQQPRKALRSKPAWPNAKVAQRAAKSSLVIFPFSANAHEGL